jgi:hypothetical protein
MDRRRDGGVRTEDGVGQFEESVGSVVEAFVEQVAEAVESIGRFHDAPIMHSQRAFRTPYLPAELERKLRDRQAPIFDAAPSGLRLPGWLRRAPPLRWRFQ